MTSDEEFFLNFGKILKTSQTMWSTKHQNNRRGFAN
jgi:hypothetical protein